jgi:hypothetical protein
VQDSFGCYSTNEKQALHDRIANTIAIDDGPIENSLPASREASLLARDESPDAGLSEDERSIRYAIDAHRAAKMGPWRAAYQRSMGAHLH